MRLQICYGKNWRGQVSRFVGNELNKIEKNIREYWYIACSATLTSGEQPANKRALGSPVRDDVIPGAYGFFQILGFFFKKESHFNKTTPVSDVGYQSTSQQN